MLHMAPMPEQPIDKGLAGPGLLAETQIAKYQIICPIDMVLSNPSHQFAILAFATVFEDKNVIT